MFKVATTSHYVFLGGHADQSVHCALKEARVTDALTVFNAQDLMWEVIAVQNLFADGPSKAHLVAKFA